MTRSFQGRAVLAGSVSGSALVTRGGFNTLASFYKSISEGAKRAICSDQDNPDLYGKDLTDKIICLPKTIGSTSAGAVWDNVAHMGMAPKAMLFSQTIDSLAAAGLVLADVWGGKRIIAVEELGDDFLKYVQDGYIITINQDGTVLVDKDE
jgi:predicted aconitase with swiveling domain